MHTTTLTKPTALSAVLLLTLTACGDSDDEADGGGEDQAAENGDSGDAEETFDFTSGFYEPVTGPYDEVLIEIPSDLLQADDAYREDRVLDAVIVRAAEHPDAQCAVEIEYLYADGVEDELESGDWEEAISWDEITLIADDYADTPVEYRHASALGLTTVSPSDDYDGDQLSDDLQTAVLPVDCAASSGDSSSVVEIQFNRIEWHEEVVAVQEEGDAPDGEEASVDEDYDPYTDGGYTPPRAMLGNFAEADINVDSEGQLHIVRSHINGWQLDANDNWITD